MPTKHESLGDLNFLMVSKHFSLAELECKGRICCGYSVKVEPELITVLEMIRSRINKDHETTHHKIIVKSGYRCPRHNKEVGGIHNSLCALDPKNSYHTHGKGADIACPTIPKRQLALIVRELAEHGPIPFRVGYYWREMAEILHTDLADWKRLGLPQIFGNGWDA